MDKRIYNNRDKKNYRKFADSHAPSSNILKDCVMSFLFGGTICVIGQAVGEICQMLGVSKENSKAVIPVVLIFLSCLLTGLGVFDKIAAKAKTGTLVPITGFANAVCSSAIDAKSEGFIFGVGAKMFVIAGPVIVYGTVSSIIYGIIYYISTVI